MADPVWQDGVTPLNAVNMTKLQTRDEKAAVNGYASLDGTGKVPAGQLPAPVTGIPLPVVNGQWIKGNAGAAIWSAITPADVPGVETTARRGAANGYAALDATGKVPAAQLPAAAAVSGAATALNPGDPGTVSTVSVSLMLGLGQAGCTLTPTKSGIVVIGFFFQISGGGFQNTATAQMRYGTGGAPGNQAALTGNPVGPQATGSDNPVPWTLVYKHAALVVGTAYWFDLSLSNTNNNSPAKVQQVAFTAIEM